MMKNKLLKTTMFCLSIALFVSCNKDKAESKPVTSNNGPFDDPIEQLRSFGKQIESVKANPGAKSDEALPIAEALWDIENHFNLTYSDAEQYYGQISDAEFTLALPLNENHEVLLCDAVNLYSDVISQARDAYVSTEFEEKGFVSLSVKETEDDGDMLYITFTGKTGERCIYDPPIPHVDGPFGIDDNWMFSAPLGKCDDPDIPSGADEQIQEKLYIELIEPYMESEPEYRNIYVDRMSFLFDGTNYVGIYYNTDASNLCIEHEYMNDYYHAEKNIIGRIIPEQYHLDGYSPISILIRGALLEAPPALTHANEIVYGKRLRISTDEFGDTKDLLSE